MIAIRLVLLFASVFLVSQAKVVPAPAPAQKYVMDEVTGKPLEPFLQNEAQAACIGLSRGLHGWVSAIPRECHGGSKQTCDHVCKHLGHVAFDSHRSAAARVHRCVNVIHVYKPYHSANFGHPGLKTYLHNSCTSTGCGPNFCCCISQ